MHELSKSINDYKSLKTTINDLKQKLNVIEESIKTYMGDAEELIVDGTVIRWKKVSQSRFDVKEFNKRHPVLYEEFLIQSETRRFTVT